MTPSATIELCTCPVRSYASCTNFADDAPGADREESHVPTSPGATPNEATKFSPEAKVEMSLETAGLARARANCMTSEQPNNPLHGVTLKAMLEDLIARRGFVELSELIPIRCFAHDPSLKSSLKFLRKTDWARARVEQLYLSDQQSLRHVGSVNGSPPIRTVTMELEPARPDRATG